MPTLDSHPDWRRWLGRAHTQWQLVRATARVAGPSARLLTTIEAHTYAYSVAANVLLAVLPFLTLLLWIARRLLPALTSQQAVIAQLAANYLPAGGPRLFADAARLASHNSAQLFSLLMLAISSSGIFLPLEVALNSIWGFKRNRGYVGNALVALGLVVVCGAIAYVSIVLSSLCAAVVQWILPAAWTGLIALLDGACLAVISIPAAILVFFVIYWKLPNGRVQPGQVFPAALYTGLAAELLRLLFPAFVRWVDFAAVYATLAIAVTLLVWGYCGALLLLFGASLSARGVARLPNARLRIPSYAELRHWYASHGHNAGEAAAGGPH